MHIVEEGVSMVGGRFRGEGRGRCHRRINRFLEPCLLLLLHSSESHGYELQEEIAGFGFRNSPADSSTIYRILRTLEYQGYVESRWDEGVSGPARRQYRLTTEGDGYLALWVDELKETDRILHIFFSEYSKHMKEHELLQK